MKVAIHQPNYIPWLGFFHKMNNCDVFVLLDNVKHSKSSVTHRNKIKAGDKELLLSVPLQNKEHIINELIIHNPDESLKKHWNAIEQNYIKANHWQFLCDELKEIYNQELKFLVDLNINVIYLIKEKLQIKTELIIASDLEGIDGEGSLRNLNICKKLNASVYLSGAGAKTYNDEESFIQNNIRIEYNQFKHPVYHQPGNSFIPNLSVIDLIFNCGPESLNILNNA